MKIRIFISLSISLLVTAAWAAESLPVMTVYKSPDCGCCGKWVEHMRASGFAVAEEHLLELRQALEQMADDPARLMPVGREALLEQARRGEVVVIDVRPQAEYQTAHLPFARSMPVAEIEKRLSELPTDKEIVAYCRGPFCLMSDEAVVLLRDKGYRVRKITDGVNEWRATGLPLQVSTGQ